MGPVRRHPGPTIDEMKENGRGSLLNGPTMRLKKARAVKLKLSNKLT
jgi:hypothetical protein